LLQLLPQENPSMRVMLAIDCWSESPQSRSRTLLAKERENTGQLAHIRQYQP